MYVIIEFDNGDIEACPKRWYDAKTQRVRWPPKASSALKIIEKNKDFKDTWKELKALLILDNIKNFREATKF